MHRLVRYPAPVSYTHLFCPGGGNLLGYVCCGNELFRIRNVVILHKQHLQPIFGIWILVYAFCNFIDIFDDSFGPIITGGSFGAEEKDRRIPIRQAAVFQCKIDVQDGKRLSLIHI